CLLIGSLSYPMAISMIRRHTPAGWLLGQVASRSSCKSFSISLATPISLAVAQSCWALSFRLTLHVRSWREIQLTSGRGGISPCPHGCEIIYLCRSVEGRKGGSCCTATL